MRSLSGAAANGAMVSLLGQWAKFLVQFGSLAVLARILGPSDFGIIAMVMAIAGFATLISDFGFSMAALQKTDVTEQQKSNIFWTNTCLGAGAALLVYVLSEPIAGLYGDSSVAAVTKVASIIFLLQGVYAQFRAECAAQFRYSTVAAAEVTGQVLGAGLAVVLALRGFGHWALVWQQLAAAAVTLVIVVVFVRWVPMMPRRNAGMRSLLGFGVKAGSVQVLNYVSANVDSVLLGRYWGASVVGTYNQAYQVFKLPLQQLASPMTMVAVPVLSRISHDDETYDRYVQRAQLVLTYVLGGAFAVAAAFSIPGFAILLGNEWPGVADIFVILAVGGLFQALGYVYYWIFLSRDMTGIQLKFALISRSAMVVFMVVGLHWGAAGVAAGSSLGLMLNWILLTWFAIPRTRVDLSGLLRCSARPAAVWMTVFAAVYSVSRVTERMLSPLAQILVMVPTLLAVLGVFAVLFSKVRGDARIIADTVRRAVRRSENVAA